uniref:Sugar phosphate phosphatase n=1 Tax=Parastrongyloides trichosuri TaxID=131310 RepID=A0A0N4ZS62_PARTI
MAEPLVGSIQGTFAFKTVHDRWPKILTKIIDQLHRKYPEIKKSKGDDACVELTGIINKLSEMRYRLMTNKELVKFDEHVNDSRYWNSYIDLLESKNKNFWYEGDWLFVECYMYKNIYEFVRSTTLINDIDPFELEKLDSLKASEQCMIKIAENLDNYNAKEMFLLSLWANKFDLSLSGGDPVETTQCFIKTAFSNDSKILVDDTTRVGYYLMESMPLNRIDIVTDNFCLEFFIDLCVGEKFIKNLNAKSIKFHLKAFPWFVSDVTQKDANFLLKFMVSSNNSVLVDLGKRWEERIKDGTFIFEYDDFWTTGASFYEMKDLSNNLYMDLKTNSGLVIFKGDLNYRKLVGDRNWNPTNDLMKSIFSFDINPFLVLRTLKSETVAGLTEDTYKSVKDTPSWMVSGEYGIIQFVPPK